MLIPAYNEEKSVGEIVRVLFNVLTLEAIPHEILVVNDHSTDHTAESTDSAGENNKMKLTGGN